MVLQVFGPGMNTVKTIRVRRKLLIWVMALRKRPDKRARDPQK